MVNKIDSVTILQEKVTDNTLIRAGKLEGGIAIPEGQRPFPDRLAEYEIVVTMEFDEEIPEKEAMSRALEKDKTVGGNYE